MHAKYRRMIQKMREKENGRRRPQEMWFLYLLECSDGSLYTGITKDLEKRLAKHNDGSASRFTRTRRPVHMVYRETCGSRAEALVRECAVKGLSRAKKEALIVERPRAGHSGRRHSSGGEKRAPRYSRFNCAMKRTLISLGQTASHSV